MTTHTIDLNQLNNMPPIVKTVVKGKYTIRTLESEYLPNADLTMRMYRSVITNQTGEIVCIAPAQSMTNDMFFHLCVDGDMRITEIIEGTMVNLFWETDKWEIATKRSVGGNYHFFRNQYFPDLPEPEQKTFRQMFLEGLGASDVNEFANSLNLSKQYCYSFVLQHPCNHIVINVNAPAAYLVSCYEIINHSCRYVDVFSLKPTFMNTNVRFPRFFDDWSDVCAHPIENLFDDDEKTRSIERKTGIMEHVTQCIQNPLNSFNVPGIMITHLQTGFRTSYENAKYAEVKLLRGNNPNLHYQYLVLRKIDKTAQFLQYFPQYSAHFAKFREHFETFATRIHRLYLNVHVLKITTLDSVTDKRDKYHIEKLHYEHFLPALKEYKKDESKDSSAKPKITRKKVVEYLDGENVMVPI